jgi:hypothetical protein
MLCAAARPCEASPLLQHSQTLLQDKTMEHATYLKLGKGHERTARHMDHISVVLPFLMGSTGDSRENH